MKQTPETIILLNFVCEDIQKAARLIRDSGIYTMVMPYTTPVERVMQEKPVGLIVCADRGVPARLCLFHGENHDLSRSGKPLHRLRRLREITDWFDKYSAEKA